MPRHRLVQIDLALFDQLKRRHGRDSLRHRSDREDAVDRRAEGAGVDGLLLAGKHRRDRWNFAASDPGPKRLVNAAGTVSREDGVSPNTRKECPTIEVWHLF